MAATDSDKNQWTDPRDYGLPFVEIKPIRAKSISVEAVTVSPILEREVEPELISTPADAIKPELILSTSPVSVEVKSTLKNPVLPTKKVREKTSAWVWSVLIVGSAIMAFIIWQIQSQSTPIADLDPPKISEESSIVEPITEAIVVPESAATDSIQSVVNQDTIQVINNSNPNISKPAESGTTIADVAKGNLIRIASKAERPQYFIIVGSLPNEKLAVEEASQYFSKSPEIYLISPEEGSRNYRLALSKFGSFRLAAEELERIKSQYIEELWILKY